MKFELKKLPKSQVEMMIELDPAEWGKFIDDAAKEISKEVKIDGFRQGHAPKDVVEKHVGSGMLLERAADLAVRKTYYKAVTENKMDAIGVPQIKVLKAAEGNPFQYQANVAILPEVKLPDYQKIASGEKKKKKEDIKVDEKEIDEAVSWLQKSRTQYATVNRPAQKGDRLEIDFKAKEKGELIEGGESKNHPLILGEGKFVPGFEDNLEGMKEGEEKNFTLTFKDDLEQKHLAGKTLDFETKVNLVQEAIVPEMTDEFAKSLGKFETAQAVRDNIKEGMAMEKEQREKEIWRAKVLEEIAKKAEMELPEVLVKGEVEKMLNEFAGNIGQMGLDMPTYLEKIKKTEDDLRKEWLPQAEKRVRQALSLWAIAEKEKIEVPQEEVEAEMNHTLSHYPDIETVKAQIDMERLFEYAKERLRNEKVFQKLENF